MQTRQENQNQEPREIFSSAFDWQIKATNDAKVKIKVSILKQQSLVFH